MRFFRTDRDLVFFDPKSAASERIFSKRIPKGTYLISPDELESIYKDSNKKILFVITPSGELLFGATMDLTEIVE